MITYPLAGTGINQVYGNKNQTYGNKNQTYGNKKQTYPAQKQTYPVQNQSYPAQNQNFPKANKEEEYDENAEEFPWGDTFPTDLESGNLVFRFYIIQWNAEIQTSLDFGQTTFAREQLVRTSEIRMNFFPLA